jgi:hypothetical protein
MNSKCESSEKYQNLRVVTIHVLHNGERKSQWKGFYEQRHKEKIDYEKANKNKK